MKLCIPVASPEGQESKLAADFGAARHLLILDSESELFEALDRAEPSTIAQSAVAEIRGVLCSEMHPHLLFNLQKNGIQVFGCEAQTAAEALAQFRAGELEAVPEIPAEMFEHEGCGCGSHGRGEGGSCGGHDHGQEGCGCQHDDPDHECCGGKGHDDPDHECCGGRGHGADHGHGGGCGCGH